MPINALRPAQEEEEEDTGKSVGDVLLAVANSGPAVLTNRFVVSVGSFGVRISFMEEAPKAGEESAKFRAAVVMTHEDAVLLYKLLRRLLKRAQADADAANAKKNG